MLANINGFWNPLLALLDHMTRLKFIRSGLSVRYLVVDRVEDILPRLEEAARATQPAEAAQAPVPEKM
jgi:predicted Rossmann-fold nucleotide-binding protein